MSNSDPITILWSGGLDSTALILKAIADNRTFETLTLNLEQNQFITDYDKIARVALRSMINLRLPEAHWEGHNEHTIPVLKMTGFSLQQQPVFLSHGCWLAANKVIWAGYVKGDCFWHYRTEALKLIEAQYGFAQKTDYDNKPIEPPRWEFPLEWSTKEDVVDLYRTLPSAIQYVCPCESGESWLVSNCPKSVELRRLVTRLIGVEPHQAKGDIHHKDGEVKEIVT